MRRSINVGNCAILRRFSDSWVGNGWIGTDAYFNDGVIRAIGADVMSGRGLILDRLRLPANSALYLAGHAIALLTAPLERTDYSGARYQRNTIPKTNRRLVFDLMPSTR
jgi:hypothetical protein